MSNELFDSFEVKSDSPKLAWKIENKISVRNIPELEPGEDEHGGDVAPWLAWVRASSYFSAKPGLRAAGVDEESALVSLAIKLNIKTWK